MEEMKPMDRKKAMGILISTMFMIMALGAMMIITSGAEGASSDGNSITMVKKIEDLNYKNVEFSPDGKLLVTSCTNGTIFAYDTSDWTLKNIVRSPYENFDIEFDPSGKMVAVGNSRWDSTQGSIHIFNTSTWAPITNMSQGSKVYSIAWSPDGKYLAAAGPPWIQIWSTSTWSPVRTFRADIVFEVAWNPNGTLLAHGNGSWDGWDPWGTPSIEVISTSSWTWKYNITDFPEQDHPFFPASICWSNDGRTLAAANESLALYNNRTCYSYADKGDSWIQPLEWRPRGKVLAAGNGSQLDLYNGTSGDIIISQDTSSWIHDISWSPNATLIAAACQWQIQIHRVELKDTGEGSGGGGETDTDLDGVHDLFDAFPTDPAASSDEDTDGYPGVWNPGKTQDDSTTGLELDRFPTDPAAYKDTDTDGSPDKWLEGKGPGDSTTGLHIDKFPTDPAASTDTDDDGAPDAWNPGKTIDDSVLGLQLDSFPIDPAASIDDDNDGHPSSWNPGKSITDSTTGLKLDIFPDDPTEWADTDLDLVGDNGDYFPTDPAASVDTDSDGYPDLWNTGKTAADSTLSLSLDKFPYDPQEWMDTDNDMVGDNGDAFPADPAASVDEDSDGLPDRWNPGKTASDSTTGLRLDPRPGDPTNADDDGQDPFWKDSVFWKTIIPIFLIILILIIIAAIFIASRRAPVRDRDPYSYYRKKVLNDEDPKGYDLSPEELDELLVESEEEGRISDGTLRYIKGYIDGEM